MKTPAHKYAILRPGAGGWELWKFRPGAMPFCESPSGLLPRSRLVTAIPTRNLVALPLWLPTGGDLPELAELELSSRHLLRRGMDARAVPLETAGARTLVLALACEEPSDVPGLFHQAVRYEAAPRLWPADGADVVIWREEASLCFALYRGKSCVFFAGGAGGAQLLVGVLKRALLRLRAEQILVRPPQLARLYGAFSEDDRRGLLSGLGFAIEYHEAAPPPQLGESDADLPPPSVRDRRLAGKSRRKVASLATAAIFAYLAGAGVFGGTLAYDYWQAGRLRAEAIRLEIPAAEAREEAARWREIRSAIDPRAFALDLLASVAAQLPSDHVRLTLFSLESGRLSLAGEAPSVPEAYAFVENIRQCPDLADFDWTAGQPRLSGKQSVRFELEGRSPDAQVVEE